MTEADTCRRFVVPALQKAGWDNEPRSIAELVHELDADGKQLRVVKLTDYTPEKARTLCTGLEDLHARWANTGQRAEIIEQLAERGVDFQTVAAQAGKPDADPFNLLCHPAYNAPSSLADCVKKQEIACFKFHTPEARKILGELLDEYADDGEIQFTLPEVLKVPPISVHGNVNEIMGKFGGATNLCDAVNQLQNLVYAP